jgi:hypothetical protein
MNKIGSKTCKAFQFKFSNRFENLINTIQTNKNLLEIYILYVNM